MGDLAKALRRLIVLDEQHFTDSQLLAHVRESTRRSRGRKNTPPGRGRQLLFRLILTCMRGSQQRPETYGRAALCLFGKEIYKCSGLF
jgi:hypothetical protein